jgi:ubiquinone/menaquinone biosynthesis C-methylase UbiE
MTSLVPTAKDYDQIYSRKRHLTILDEIEAGVVGDPEITGLRCTGFLGPGDREHVRDLLARSMASPNPSGALLDLGCGTGLLGAWMAAQLQADLVAIDFSPVAISIARRLAAGYKSIKKTFQVASFDSTGLEGRSVAAAFSLDALYLAQDPGGALKELQRIMMPGAPLVFTYYLHSRDRLDWLQLTKDAGLTVLAVADLTATWRARMKEKHLRRWAHRDAIKKELRQRANPELSVTASMLGLDGRPSYIESTVRYLIHAAC